MSRDGNRTGGGSRKGIPNKATTQAREAIAMFVENNVDRLCGWLDEIAQDNPKAAFDSFMSVVEYHIPKLARSDINHSGKIDGDLIVSVDDGDLIRRALEKLGEKNE